MPAEIKELIENLYEAISAWFTALIDGLLNKAE